MANDNEREVLAGEIEKHVAEEERILTEYHALSESLPDGLLRVLVNHIVTEEKMHHFLLRTLVEWLRESPIATTGISKPSVDLDALLARTRTLREHERDTIEACRSLRFELSDEAEEVLEVLLGVIALDSEKHHRLLSLVESQIGDD